MKMSINELRKKKQFSCLVNIYTKINGFATTQMNKKSQMTKLDECFVTIDRSIDRSIDCLFVCLSDSKNQLSYFLINYDLNLFFFHFNSDSKILNKNAKKLFFS